MEDATGVGLMGSRMRLNIAVDDINFFKSTDYNSGAAGAQPFSAKVH